MKIAKRYNNVEIEELACKIAKLSEINIEKCYNEEFECYMAINPLLILMPVPFFSSP